MGRVSASVAAGLMLIFFLGSVVMAEERVNTTSDSVPAAEVLHDLDQADGGFSSLDGMLQWAIGHSDPAKLQLKARDVESLSAEDLNKRQLELKELMEKIKMPSDANLMQIAIDDLKNSSLPLEERHRALEELLVLVESIDNANDLHRLGGLAVVVGELSNSDAVIRSTSAWILGKASQNNPVLQKQVLELGALPKLMTIVKSNFMEEANKALYTISALTRNNLDGQELFYTEGGGLMLQEILSNSTADIRLRRKSAFLVADLAECLMESKNKAEPPVFSNCFFLKSVVNLTASDDLDLQEKALLAIKNLLLLRSTKALVLKEFCGLDEALERMRQKLQLSLADENRREYAMDVESLRREVNLIFLEKLNKVPEVPT